MVANESLGGGSAPIEHTSSHPTFTRVNCEYKNLSERFLHEKKEFSRQFAHIYAVRLSKMSELLLKRVRNKWGPDIPVLKLFELQEDESQRCVILGTLFKHQELKPSILKEISEEHQLIPQPARTNFVDESDELILEDELQRIRLIGDLNVHMTVTGVVCAILGTGSGDGKFVVEDYCWAGPPDVVERPLQCTESRFVVLLSGLDLANSGDSLMPLQLFVDWIGGLLGSVEEQQQQTLTVRIIIAGNSVKATPDHKSSVLQNTFKGDKNATDVLEATKLLDDFLVQLASSINIDVMPGEFDPSNHMLPQQPLHFCMLPQTSVYKTMHGVPNPYECEVGGRRLLGTSGQPIEDVARYSKLTDPLEILQQTLEWAHLSPTSPDTLPCYPYYQEDPFIISECPDVIFAGNQPHFQTKLYKGKEDQIVRLICVPSFAKSHSCVMVNLMNLDCHTVNFSVSSPSSPVPD